MNHSANLLAVLASMALGCHGPRELGAATQVPSAAFNSSFLELAVDVCLEPSCDADMDYLEVFVDGAFVGNADRGSLWLPLGPGEHSIRVELAQHDSVERTVTVLKWPKSKHHQVLYLSLTHIGG